jgi:3-deoxy-D-manno-octulosonate 8-phosphate phosphatase (KDO 8-P phosphatase)
VTPPGPVVRPGAEERAAKVRLLLLDVDGVLSDGGILYDGDGRESKRFHVRDGHGIVLLHRAGIETGIVSGRSSAATDVRARELKIGIVRQGVQDKAACFREILEERGLSAEQVAFVGDDIVDLPALRAAGFAAAVADAEPYLFEAVHFVTSRRGGQGAVREVAEFILRATGNWEKACARYFPPGECR